MLKLTLTLSCKVNYLSFVVNIVYILLVLVKSRFQGVMGILKITLQWGYTMFSYKILMWFVDITKNGKFSELIKDKT